jgi:hypothetical protein
MERRLGITPEMKRYNEIKAGVITASVGIAVAIFLYFLMQGIILSGEPSASEAEILKRIWIAGVIPVFVGLSLIVNGVFISKRQVEISKRARGADFFEKEAESQHALPAANTAEFIPTGFSVTEHTTQHLKQSSPNKQ